MVRLKWGNGNAALLHYFSCRCLPSLELVLSPAALPLSVFLGDPTDPSLWPCDLAPEARLRGAKIAPSFDFARFAEMASAVAGPWMSGFIKSFGLILASEIGDKVR